MQNLNATYRVEKRQAFARPLRLTSEPHCRAWGLATSARETLAETLQTDVAKYNLAVGRKGHEREFRYNSIISS